MKSMLYKKMEEIKSLELTLFDLSLKPLLLELLIALTKEKLTRAFIVD